MQENAQRADNRRLDGRLYAPLVASLFENGLTAIVGGAASAAAIAMCYWITDNVHYLMIAAAMLVISAGRYLVHHAYRANFGDLIPDSAQAKIWEGRFTIGGVSTALTLAAWCVYAGMFCGHSFTVFSAYTVSLANVVAVCSRNYPIARLVSWQVVAMGAGMVIGLIGLGGAYQVLAVLIGLLMVTVLRLADAQRATLFGRLRAQERERRISRQFLAALDNLPHGVCMFDNGRRLRVANEVLRNASGMPDSYIGTLTLDEAVEKSCDALNISQTDRERLRQCVAPPVVEQRSMTFSTHLGTPRICKFIVKPTPEGGVMTTFEDITRERNALDKLDEMTRHDTLTRLFNRDYLVELLERRLRHKDPMKQKAVLIVSLDRFKPINETLGFSVGDELLVQAASRLRELVGDLGDCCRHGGDEFAVMIDRRDAMQTARALADQIVEALLEPFRISDSTLRVGCTIGIAVSSEGTETAQLLFSRANTALHSAKRDGTIRYLTFDEELSRGLSERRQLEIDIQTALENGELEAYFQPIVNLNEPRLKSFEALLRWNHPDRGMISPGVFIPIAEELGIIADLGDWVLREACRTCATWPKDIGVSVNLSAQQFRSGDIIASVREALTASALEPRRLDLEITESLMLWDIDEVKVCLTALKEMGVRISLDDFGTGYSSLGYLNSLPLDRVKIDRSFVEDLRPGSKSMALLRSIAALSDEIGLRTVVEGVETKEQLSLLIDHCSIDEVQGFYFSKPLPAEDVRALFTYRADALREMIDRAKPYVERQIPRLLDTARAG